MRYMMISSDSSAKSLTKANEIRISQTQWQTTKRQTDVQIAITRDRQSHSTKQGKIDTQTYIIGWWGLCASVCVELISKYICRSTRTDSTARGASARPHSPCSCARSSTRTSDRAQRRQRT